MDVKLGYSKLEEVLGTGTEPYLMSGDQYKESLRDGRRIIDAEGNEVEDITAHPAFKNSINRLAELYDMQFDPKTRDITTYIDPKDHNRYSLSWLLPQTKEDLKRRRELNRLSTYHTLGVFGRPNDYGPLKAMGYLLIIDRIREKNPELAENVMNFIKMNKKLNAMSTDLVPDVQSDRTVPPNQRPGRLRIVEENSDGIVLYGAKPAGSLAAQTHFLTISTGLSPGLGAKEALWISVPVNSKGLTLVLREPVTNPDASFENHPLDSFGEEMDNMVVFDNVFVPRKYLFSIKDVELLEVYTETGILPHWHILSRLMYRSEIFSGVAQTIVDILGTEPIQGVRDNVTEVLSYSATLKAFILASEEEAVYQNGVMIPSRELITAGRLHSIVNYPKIMHILRDLSGQGLISRFTNETWKHPDVGDKFDEFLRGTGVSAKEKNRFFNFVWDLTCSSHASRVALFENVNSTNAPIVKSQLYKAYNRNDSVEYIRDYLKLPAKH